jgi:hypothetical protein
MIKADFNLKSIDFLMREVLGMELIDINNGRYHYHKVNPESEYNVKREYFIDIDDNYNRDYGAKCINFKRDKYINGSQEPKNYDKRTYSLENSLWKVFIKDISMKTFSATDSLCEDEIIGRFNRLYNLESLLG